MAPKKKPARNGFAQFMLEIKHERGLSSMAEAQKEAGEIWKNMSDEEKAPYKSQALSDRRVYEREKLTNLGVPIDDVERARHEDFLRVERMRKDTVAKFKYLMEHGGIHSHPLLIIHLNKLLYHTSADRYYVCEIAIAAFTLEDGVKPEGVFHGVVKPGPLPMGWRQDAVHHSNNTHQMHDIVLDQEDNTHEVFREMSAFLNRFADNNAPLILYAQEKSIGMTRSVLQFWSEAFRAARNYDVHNLEYMLYALKNAVGRNVWPTDTLAYKEIDRDVYSHVSGIACDFHETADVTVFCSKSIVTRFAYSVCDLCCPHLDIELIPGLHVPQNAEVKSVSRPASRASVASTASKTTWRVDTSSVAASDDDFYSDSFPALGARSSASSYKTFQPSDASTHKTYASSVDGTCESDINSVREKLKNIKLPRRNHLN